MKKITIILALSLMQTAYSQIFIENFENCEGTYSEFGVYSDGSSDYFIRTNGTTETVNCVASSTTGKITFTNTTGFYYTAEDTDRPAENPNTSGEFGSQVYSSGVHFTAIDISSYNNVKISCLLAARNAAIFEPGLEYIKIYVDINNTGSWELIGAAECSSGVASSTMSIDTDLNGVGDGAVLNEAFQNFTFDVPDGGSLMNVRIEVNSSSGSEELAFDSFQVTGDGVLSNGHFKNDKEKIELYPNPTTEFVNLRGVKHTLGYKIFNVLGAEISNGLIIENQRIDVKHLANGLYYLKINEGDIIKFIKK